MSTELTPPWPWTMTTVPTAVGSCHKIGPFPSLGARSETYACVYADGCRIGIDDHIPVAATLRAIAVLMTAAPELLSAARAAVDAMEAYRIDDANYHNTKLPAPCDAELALIAAIAAAEVAA